MLPFLIKLAVATVAVRVAERVAAGHFNATVTPVVQEEPLTMPTEMPSEDEMMALLIQFVQEEITKGDSSA